MLPVIKPLVVGLVGMAAVVAHAACTLSVGNGSASCTGTNASGGACQMWIGTDATTGQPSATCAIAFNPGNLGVGIDLLATGKVQVTGNLPRVVIAAKAPVKK